MSEEAISRLIPWVVSAGFILALMTTISQIINRYRKQGIIEDKVRLSPIVDQIESAFAQIANLEKRFEIVRGDIFFLRNLNDKSFSIRSQEKFVNLSDSISYSILRLRKELFELDKSLNDFQVADLDRLDLLHVRRILALRMNACQEVEKLDDLSAKIGGMLRSVENAR